MSTDPEPTKRQRLNLIHKIKGVISLARTSTREKIGQALNKPKIKTLKEKVQDLKTEEWDIQIDTDFKIYSMKYIYVLAKSIKIEEVKVKKVPDSIQIAPVKATFKNFTKFDIIHTIENQHIEEITTQTTTYPYVVFSANIKELIAISFKEITPGMLEAKSFKKPKFLTEKVGFKASIKQRSQIFPINLPVTRKPISLLMFSEPEMVFFKKKLGEKFKLNWRLIKLTSLYNKLNVKNIQNIKVDPISENVFFTFKPQIKYTEELFAYMVFGKRLDTNQPINLMVNELEFRKFKSEYTQK